MMASFTAKITARFAILVTGTTALVLAIGGWLFWRLAINGLDYLNSAEFVEVHDRLGSHPSSLAPSELEKRLLDHAEIDASLYFFQVYRADGTLVFRSPNMGHAILPTLQENEKNRSDELTGIGAVRIGNYEDENLRIQIASPLEPVSRLSQDFLRVSVILLVGVAVTSVGVGWQFARLTLRPVRTIRETANRIRADNLSERIPVPAGKDELAALARLLNQMFDRLEQSFDQIQQFTADASHELKTPLALIRLNAERLRTKLTHDAEASATCDDLLESIDEVGRVIEILLFLAKAETGVLSPTRVQFDAQNFIQNFAADALVLAEDSAKRFEVTRTDKGIVHCEPTLIRQLLLNLVTNALNVTEGGGTVKLESIITGPRWILSVIDEGPGIPAEQLNAIFERFVRYAPTAGKSGHGLGLAICRSIAAMHDGKVYAQNRPDRRGLKFVVDIAASAEQGELSSESRHGTANLLS